jgi:hypothetical protein
MPRKCGASQFIGLNRHRVSASDLKVRLEERDRRQLADSRTEAEKYLGDPPPNRSALAQMVREEDDLAIWGRRGSFLETKATRWRKVKCT